MFAQPLILLLLGSSALASQTPLGTPNNKCFGTTESGVKNYNACCSGAQEGLSWLNNAGDAPQAFKYVCASYISKHKKEFESVHSARACAEICANDASCHAASWASDIEMCFTTSDTDLQFVDDDLKAFLRLVKVTDADIPPTEDIECGDQVAQERLSCENEQEEKCKSQMETREQDLRSQCDQRIQDQCSESNDVQAAEKCKKEKAALEKSLRSECEVDKNNAAKQREADQAARDAQNRKARDALEEKLKKLQKQEEENKKKADEDKKALDQLLQQNKQLRDELKKGSPKQQEPPAKQPPKSSDEDPVYEVPPLAKFNRKCTDMEGQEYTVMGVTYTVFCSKHPDDGAPAKREWRAKDPAFLMGMCSTTPGCQGVKLRENFAQLSFKHEYPPSQSVDRKYWSLVPKEQHANTNVPDIRSRFMDDDNSVRCPEVDGQIITLGDNSYQLNCKKNFTANKRKTATGVKNFNECLVSCSVTRGCKGIMGGNTCSLVYSHHVLPRETPEEEQSKGNTWVAMLTHA